MNEVVPKSKVDSFIKLYDVIYAIKGSKRQAAEFIGIKRGQIDHIKTGNINLSFSVAKKILAAYKACA